MGHSLSRSLVRSHRSLVRSLAHSLAPELVGRLNIFVQISKCPTLLCRFRALLRHRPVFHLWYTPTATPSPRRYRGRCAAGSRPRLRQFHQLSLLGMVALSSRLAAESLRLLQAQSPESNGDFVLPPLFVVVVDAQAAAATVFRVHRRHRKMEAVDLRVATVSPLR